MGYRMAPVNSQGISNVHWVWPVNANLAYGRQRIETFKTHMLYNATLQAITPQMKPVATLTSNTIAKQKTRKRTNRNNGTPGKLYSATQTKNTGV